MNWAAFAQEVNRNHRSKRGDRKRKLEYCKEHGVSKQTKQEMQQIKLEAEPSSMGPVENSKKVSIAS